MKTSSRTLAHAVRSLRIFALFLIPLVLLPIFAGWVGDLVKERVEDPQGITSGEWWLFAIGLVGLFLSLLLAVREGRKLIPARVVDQRQGVKPHSVLVALLSPCNNLERIDGPTGPEWQVRDQKTDHKASLSGRSLDELRRVDRNLPQWTWQQTLRATYPHREGLERLVLLGSKNGSGTPSQLNLAHDFFSTWFSGKVEVLGKAGVSSETDPDSWCVDFEDLDATQAVLRRAIERLRRCEHHYQDTDIVIDVTGGPKTASIAAAMVTLDRPDLTFQYVGTGSNAEKIFGFNVTTEHHGA